MSSKSNSLIYGTIGFPPVPPPLPKKETNKQDVKNVCFLYGTNENTNSIMDYSYNRANIVAVEAKTPSQIHQKVQHAIDGRKEYSKFLERKQQKAEEIKVFLMVTAGQGDRSKGRRRGAV